MNKNVAKELVRIAKEIMASRFDLPSGVKKEDVIAIKGGYYTNSGLDMGQYHSERTLDLIVYEKKGNIYGYSYLFINMYSESRNVEEKDVKKFGDIDSISPSVIERWARGKFEDARIDYKKGWGDLNSQGKEKFDIDRLIREFI